MHPASSNRRQVCAPMGHSSNSRKSLSAYGPLRVPLSVATMMAEIINRQQGAGLMGPFQAVGCANALDAMARYVRGRTCSRTARA
jgi:hypothetical protein